MERVMVFIDGFNLYYGLKAKHQRKYLWLDLEAMMTTFLRPNQQLVQIKYFTARVRDNPDAEARQADYLEALDAHCSRVLVIPGRFQEKDRRCRACAATWVDYEEKETDVSIAVSLVEEGMNDAFDVAMILSGDSDLCPAVRAVRRNCPDKTIISVFPPKRSSFALRGAVHAVVTLGDARIRHSLLPDVVISKAGQPLKRPDHWR